MLDQQDLQAIKAIIQGETEPIKKDIAQMKADIEQLKNEVSDMKEDIAQLKEDTEITRDVTNSIGEWIDFYFKEDRPYPIPEEPRKIS
ncbi:MAG: hypothetical protein IK990_18760 [Ruminiclostridium sp.]|nr:hypothetical protein [Ruminiclostridium sp.]